MKLTYKLFLILFSIALFSCMEEAFVEGPTAAQGLTAEIPSYQFDNQTRVNISQNLSTFTWSDGDMIGLYFQNQNFKTHAGFTIVAGGGNKGTFRNDVFILWPNTTYYAFYPYDATATIDSYPIDFTGQVQTINAGTAHIEARNYMSAVVNTDDSGAASLVFQNQAAVIQVVVRIEEAGIYTGVIISSEAEDFIIQGTLDMETGEVTPTKKCQQMELSLGEGIMLNKGDVLTANLLVPSIDLRGKKLSVMLETNKKIYEFPKLEGMYIQKGKAYQVDCESGEIDEIPYLTFIAASEQTLTLSKTIETLEYSVNGAAWQELGTKTVTFGGSYGNLKLRGKSEFGTAFSYLDYSKISFGNSTPVACTGDIRTLVDFENYSTTDTSNARFSYLFYNCTGLTRAPELPATTLANYCYSYMFSGCTGLTRAPELPATTLANYCYSYMFSYTNAFPDFTHIDFTVSTAPQGWQGMFAGTKITDEDLMRILPLNKDGEPCLPATTLTANCYSGMFSDCTELTQAPELPATTLTDYCYSHMFSGCTKLNSIKIMATDINAPGCLDDWTKGVSSSGTFVKNPSAYWDVRGECGIPVGWKIDGEGEGDGNGIIIPGTEHEG